MFQGLLFKGSKVEGFSGLGFRARVEGLGFRAQGFGFRDRGPLFLPFHTFWPLF